MDKKVLNKKLQNLQNMALILGMSWEADQSPMFAEAHLSDFISDVVDKTNKIMDYVSADSED